MSQDSYEKLLAGMKRRSELRQKGREGLTIEVQAALNQVGEDVTGLSFRQSELAELIEAKIEDIVIDVQVKVYDAGEDEEFENFVDRKVDEVVGRLAIGGYYAHLVLNVLEEILWIYVTEES